MSVHEQAFLRAVIENPDDDAPRLIYADWLDEQGQSERAEFIRVQVERARLPIEDNRYSVLEAREKELQDHHAATWCQGQPAWVGKGVVFHRGFPTGLHCTFTQWLQRAPRLLNWAPIQWLELSRIASAKVAALAGCPQMAAIKVLRLPAFGVDLPAVELLASSPYLAGLEMLKLRRGMVGSQQDGDAVASALTGSPHLARLTALSLAWVEVREAGCRTLGHSQCLTNLKVLDLENGLLGDAAVQALPGPALTNLVALDLGQNHICASGVEALAASPHLANLSHLSLRWNQFGIAGLRAILSSPYLTKLSSLNLHGNEIGPEGARALSESHRLAGLRELYLYSGRMGDEGVRTLAESPHLSGLHTLDLSGNAVTEAGLKALAASPYLGNLRRLGLFANGLGKEIQDWLLRQPRLPQLAEVLLYQPYYHPSRFDADLPI